MNVNYFQKANQLKQEGKLEEAIISYQCAIQSNPIFYWSHQNLGEVLLKLGRWDEAVTHYRKAIDLNSNSAWFHYYLGEALIQLEKWSEAVVAYRGAIEIEPNSAQFHTRLGEALYQISLKIDQESLHKYIELAEVLFKTENRKGSETELGLLNDRLFLQATEKLNDKDFIEEVYRSYLGREGDEDGKNNYYRELSNGINRGEIISGFRSSQEFKNQLLESFRRISLHCLNDDLFFQATESLEDNYFVEEVYHTYLKREANPGGKSFYCNQIEKGVSRSVIINAFRDSPEFGAKLLASVRLFYLKEAYRVFYDLTEIYPNYDKYTKRLFEIVNHLGIMFTQCGKLDEATQLYKKFHFTQSNLIKSLNSPIEIQEKKQANHDIELDTNLSQVHYNQGNLLFQQGKLDEAIESYHKAINLNPNLAEAYYYLAEALVQYQRLDEAIYNYQAAISLVPVWVEHLNIGNKLVNLFTQQGKLDMALNWLEKILEIKDFL